MQESVNPDKFDWHSAWKDIDVASLHEKWETLRATQPDITVPDLPTDTLDDFQQLFVTLVLQHAEDVVVAWRKNRVPKPLRLMLLGTAGTGKTTASKAMLHKLLKRDVLRGFVRVAAPTGTAAFNIGFNATTVRRLIHWFNPTFFREISNTAVSYTHLTLPTKRIV